MSRWTSRQVSPLSLFRQISSGARLAQLSMLCSWSLAVKKGGIAGTSRAVILPLPFRDRSLQDYAAFGSCKIKDDCCVLWFWCIWDIYSNPYLGKCIQPEAWSLNSPCQSRCCNVGASNLVVLRIRMAKNIQHQAAALKPERDHPTQPRNHCSHCKFPVWEEAADLFFDDLRRPLEKAFKPQVPGSCNGSVSDDPGTYSGSIKKASRLPSILSKKSQIIHQNHPGLTSPGYTSTSPTTAVSLGVRIGMCWGCLSYSSMLEFEILLRI